MTCNRRSESMVPRSFNSVNFLLPQALQFPHRHGCWYRYARVLLCNQQKSRLPHRLWHACYCKVTCIILHHGSWIMDENVWKIICIISILQVIFSINYRNIISPMNVTLHNTIYWYALCTFTVAFVYTVLQ